MSNLQQQIKSLIKENGLTSILRCLIENFDEEADMASLSNLKKLEYNNRKIAISILDALNKIDSI